ncbi:MAG: 2-amino-4-hydroxy-6-hydroxymethyldihydropteridine diphosphokinase [Deltaproteobacteria bacterium]|nr:2-amino-4-hydroxy-6-hydroxymethyldihydropteridine diphosphokinase [Deltaproteobacteria bacterium]
METVYIGIGSNIGDKKGNCLDAIDRIGRLPGCRIENISRSYLTEPVGVEESQDWYMNGVISVLTSISAPDLMKELLEIEAVLGRVRAKRWEPRIIDLDIIFFGSKIIQEDHLVVPHPLMHQRRFVLKPMADLAPDFVHPVLNKGMRELLLLLPENRQAVTPIRD